MKFSRVGSEDFDRQPAATARCPRVRGLSPTRHPIAALYLWAWARDTWMRSVLAEILVKRPGAFIDVGANVGQTMLEVLRADRHRRYVGFEPNPYCVRALQSLVIRNGLTQCTIVPASLWSGFAVRNLIAGRFVRIDPGGSMQSVRRSGRRFTEHPAVCLSLDQIVDAIGIADIAVIKIDVEDAEATVLDGMTACVRRWRPTIVCELLRRDRREDASDYLARVERLQAILSELNYRPLLIERAWRKPWALRAVDRFPVDPWRRSRWNRCDYLFVPAEEVASYSERSATGDEL